MSCMGFHGLRTQHESERQHPLESRGKALQGPFPRLARHPAVGTRAGTRLGCLHRQACVRGREARPSSLPDASGEGQAISKREDPLEDPGDGVSSRPHVWAERAGGI